MNTSVERSPDRSSAMILEMPEPIQGESADLAFLHGMAARMAATAPFQDMLEQVIESAASVVKCDSCCVYILEDNDLVLQASRNPHPGTVNRLKLKPGHGSNGWITEHLGPVIVSQDAFRDLRFQRFNQPLEDRCEAFLCVPVLSRGRVAGIINLQSLAPHVYSDRETTFISTMGLLVGAEIERARLEIENSLLLDKLETRTFVERAKGILQRDLNMSEDDAYRIMQRESQQRRKSMREIAEAVIVSDELKTPRCSGKVALSRA
jgi:uroporphyrinogen-III synthase